MDYSKILQELNQASLFDLHRLRSAIYQELQNPKRIDQIKAQLTPGQSVSYFNSKMNSQMDAIILEINRMRCLVQNKTDLKRWNVRYFSLNIDGVDADIQADKNTRGIPKNVLKIGAKVGFKDKNHHEHFGVVIRRNQKSATVKVNGLTEWRVAYSLLFPVIEGETADIEELSYLSVDHLQN